MRFLMRKYIINLILLIIIAPIKSQGTNYELQELSVEQYISSTSSIVNQFTDRYDNILITIFQEFNLRYGNRNLTEIDLDSLIAFQTSMGIGSNFWVSGNEHEWFKAILEVALDDVDIIELPSQFTLGNFEITASSINVDEDSEIEYLLEVYDRFSWRRFYAVLNEDIYLLPIPIVGLIGDAVTRMLPTSGELTIVRIEDIDNDGNDELIIEGSDYGSWSSCGDIYVIDWQSEEFINLSNNLFHYCLPMAQSDTASVEINTNLLNKIELIETRIDGWNCERVRTDTIEFNTKILQSVTNFSDTTWCDFREANILFQAQEYETAIVIYTRILPEFEGQLAQYIIARLALSYALNNQLNNAELILSAIEPEGQMGTLIMALSAVSEQPLDMCRVAYDFFEDINNTREDQFANPYPWKPDNFYFGTEATDPRYYPLPVPARAGCNYQLFQPDTMQVTTTLVTQPNIDRFVQQNIYLNLINKEYENTLIQINFFLNSTENNYYSRYTQQLQYWRAITFELMGSYDDALTEYVAIYQENPESWWGQLAALHFD